MHNWPINIILTLTNYLSVFDHFVYLVLGQCFISMTNLIFFHCDRTSILDNFDVTWGLPYIKKASLVIWSWFIFYMLIRGLIAKFGQFCIQTILGHKVSLKLVHKCFSKTWKKHMVEAERLKIFNIWCH